MFLTAYETLACRAYNTAIIGSKLNLSKIEDGLQNVRTPEGKHVKNVFGVMPGNDDVPAFTHPYYKVEDRDYGYFYIDARPYLRQERNGDISISNAADYKFQLVRAMFNVHWQYHPEDLLNLGEMGPLIFCRWLTDAIVKRMGLNPAEQARVMTVTLFYWYSLFRQEEEFDEKDKQRIVTKLSRISSIPSNIAMEVVDQITYMNGLPAYVSMLQAVVGSVRLEKLSPALIFAMLGGSWFGLNAKETIAVATEHPPTFLAIVLSSLESRSYRKSILGRMVYENDRRGNGATFTRNAYHLLESQLGDQ